VSDDELHASDSQTLEILKFAAEVVKCDFVTGNGFEPAAFQIVIAAVDHFAGLGKLIEISFNDVLYEVCPESFVHSPKRCL
jgi:hypothetical protein